MSKRVKNDDTFRISLRGACLIAAQEYEKAFGPDPNGKTTIQIANEMAKNLEHKAHIDDVEHPINVDLRSKHL